MNYLILNIIAAACSDGEQLNEKNCTCNHYVEVAIRSKIMQCRFELGGKTECESSINLIGEDSNCLCPMNKQGTKHFVQPAVTGGGSTFGFYCTDYSLCRASCNPNMILNCSTMINIGDELLYYVLETGQACFWCPANHFCNGVVATPCPEGAECDASGVVSCKDLKQYIDTEKNKCVDCPQDYKCDGKNIFCGNGIASGTKSCQCQSDGKQYINKDDVCSACPDPSNHVEKCEKGFVSQCDDTYFLTADKRQCLSCPEGGWCNDNKLYCYHNIQSGTKLAENAFCGCHETSQYMDTEGRCQPCIGVCEDSKLINCHSAHLYIKDGRCHACPTWATCDGILIYCGDGIMLGTDNCVCKTNGSQYLDNDSKCQFCYMANFAFCDGSNILSCRVGVAIGYLGCSCNRKDDNAAVPDFENQLLLCNSEKTSKNCLPAQSKHVEDPCLCPYPRKALLDGQIFYCATESLQSEVPGLQIDPNNSSRIIRCPELSLLDKSLILCNVCPAGFICDGSSSSKACTSDYCFLGQEAPCPVDATCKNGFAVCIDKKQYLSLNQVCSDCGDLQCNGTHIVACSTSPDIDVPIVMLDQCIECPVFCHDGLIQGRDECSYVDWYDHSILEECASCDYLTLLSLDKRQCLPCPAFAQCDGSQEIVCDETFMLTEGKCLCHPTSQFITHMMICGDCPPHGICNGLLIMSCLNGYMLFEQQCKCRGNMYESPSGVCGQCMSHASCSNGLPNCNTNFEFDQLNEQCKCVDGSSLDVDKCVCQKDHYMLDEKCTKCVDHGHCNGESIVSCIDGFFLKDGLCVCLTSMFINSNEQCVDCPFNAKCFNNKFQCLPTFKETDETCLCDATSQIQTFNMCVCSNATLFLNLLKNQCTECPKFGECDGTSDVVCTTDTTWDPSSSVCQLTDSTCTLCHVQSGKCVYDDNLNLACEDETQCQPNFDINSQCQMCDNSYQIENGQCVKPSCPVDEFWDKSCQPCPEYATCHGTKQIDCNQGFTLNLNKCDCTGFVNQLSACVACPQFAVCSGPTIVCRETFVVSADSQRCVCEETHYFSTDKCVACPEGIKCDGFNIVGCADGFQPEGTSCLCKGNMTISNNKCVKCPQGAQCLDGAITECLLGYELDEDQNMCICAEGKLLDNSANCVDCPKHSTCKDHKIEACDETFILSDDKYSCVCRKDLGQSVVNDKCGCQPDQYIHSVTQICTQCPQAPIASCDGVSVTCDEGYKFENDICNLVIKDCADCAVESGKCHQSVLIYSCEPGTVCKVGFDIVKQCRFCFANYDLINSQCALQYCFDKSQFVHENACQSCPGNAVCDGRIMRCADGFLEQELSCVKPEENRLQTWEVSLIVVGTVVAALVVAGLAYFFIKLYQKKRFQPAKQDDAITLSNRSDYIG